MWSTPIKAEREIIIKNRDRQPWPKIVIDGGGVDHCFVKRAVCLLGVRDHGVSLLGLNVVNAYQSRERYYHKK